MVTTIVLVLCCIIAIGFLWIKYYSWLIKTNIPSFGRVLLCIIGVSLAGPGMFYLLHELLFKIGRTSPLEIDVAFYLYGVFLFVFSIATGIKAQKSHKKWG